MATLTPEVDIAAALATALTKTVGVDIKYGPPRSPTEAGNDTPGIWVIPYTDDAAPFLNASVDGSLWTSRMQILVRGAADSYGDAISTARAVRDALHTKQTASYVAWVLTPGVGGPNYLGPNEAGQHEFSVNVTATWKATN